MKFLGKSGSQKPSSGQQAGRQRPAVSDQSRPQAFSYYSQRSGSARSTGRTAPEDVWAAESDRPATTLSLSKRLYTACAAVVLLVIAVFGLYLGSEPKIVLLNTAGSAYFLQDEQTYRQTAARTLAGSLFNKNKLTVDTRRVSDDLKHGYPEIRSVTVALPTFGHQPVVYISPYRPSFILTTTASTAYLLDENGRALISTSQIPDTGKLGVPTLQDASGHKVTLDTQVVSSATIRFTETVIAILTAANIPHGTLTLPAAASELDVAIAGKPYKVKFNLQGDPRQQAGAFIATKKRLEKDRISPGQYIDVRVPERAYYK
jgi:hypothetical protein